MFSRRICNFMGVLAAIGLLAFALYLENYEFLNPCPLCYAQRIIVGLVGLWFLFATIVPGQHFGRIVNGLLIVATALGGAAVSIRHLYLQNLPKDQVPACGPDFYALVEKFPFSEVFMTSITGTGDCAEVQWTFLGLSIPGWTLVCFIGFAIWGVWHNWFRR